MPHRLRTLLLAPLVAVAVTAIAALTGGLGTLEDHAVDLRFELRPDQPTQEVAVVAIDDVTFSDTGWQWPFDRREFAKVTDLLHEAGAREIVHDVQFTEESDDADADWAFFESLGNAGGGVLATSETDGKGGHLVLGGPDNLKEIGAVAGASNMPHEDAGVIRRVWREAGGLPSIATQVAKRLGKPVDRGAYTADGAAWIDFRGGPGTIPTYSFSDVVNRKIPAARFKGRVVVVGSSAATLQDLHPTSADRDTLMPGPEIQANAIWTALHGFPLRSAPAWLGLLAIGLLALAVPLAALKLGPIATLLFGTAIGGAYAGVAYLAFTDGTMLAVAGPLVALVVSTVTTMVAGQILERALRRRVTRYNEELEAAVRERTAELDELQREILERLGQAVDSRDEETGEHINRITTLAHGLATAIGMDADRAEMVRRASAMHDVGKVAIPDSILQHSGPLSPEMRRVMETHTTTGARLLAGSRSPLVQMGEVIALTHHEKWNGKGYPHGLSGEDIPLEGRIVAVCDVYDALISRRPYKEPWTPEEALAEIERSSGTHFDPELAAAFVAMIRADLQLETPVLTTA